MSQDRHDAWEDEEALRLLDEMATARADDPRILAAGSGKREAVLRRAFLEALGQLPFELPEISPAPELRSRLLTRLNQPAPERLEALVEPSEVPRGRRNRETFPRWVMPLAASLAVFLVCVTAWQVWRVEQQAMTIARLSAELERANVGAADLAVARAMLAETRARLDLVIGRDARYCALRPIGSARGTGMSGTLVMVEGRSDWFLRIEGLEPCGAGRQYKLWFVTGPGHVLGASFQVEAGSPILEMRGGNMPDGVEAVMVTVEQSDVEESPLEPALLYGDERMQIL